MTERLKTTVAEFLGLRHYRVVAEKSFMYQDQEGRSGQTFLIRSRLKSSDFRFDGFIYGEICRRMQVLIGQAVRVVSVNEVKRDKRDT